MLEQGKPFEEWQWQTLEALLQDLAQQFDSNDPEADATQALTTLRMEGKYSDWPDFLSEFTKLHAMLTFDDHSKVSQLSIKVSYALTETALKSKSHRPPKTDYKG